MPVDPKGISPGVVSVPEEPREINLKCRNPNCPSIKAIELPTPGMPGHRYQCVRCKNVWSINLGGAFEY